MPQTPVPVPRRFRIIAHRGASGYGPENTMAAFRLAKEMGAREVELDVQFSKDSALMVCHDTEFSRYGHPGKRIERLTRAQLQALDMGAWFGNGEYAGARMIALDELFDNFKTRFIYHVEIKTPAPGLSSALLACIEKYGLQSSVFITSFHFDALAATYALSHRIPLGWLVRKDGFSAKAIQEAAAAGFSQICPAARDVTPARVAAAHRRIREVRAHSVSTREDMMRVIAAGCDGLTINWPDWLTHEEKP
jgi:glycerophosphoryl diester phosphodiesterase